MPIIIGSVRSSGPGISRRKPGPPCRCGSALKREQTESALACKSLYWKGFAVKIEHFELPREPWQPTPFSFLLCDLRPVSLM